MPHSTSCVFLAVSVTQLSPESIAMNYLPAGMILPGCLLFFFQGCLSRSSFSPPESIFTRECDCRSQWRINTYSNGAGVSCTSTDSKVEISCLIINLEYIECNWTKPQLQHINYTFGSEILYRPFLECPEYLQEEGQNVGCRTPIVAGMRFQSFYTKLSVGGNQSICKNYTDLRPLVKLNPPYNLSVNTSGRDSEVCAHWKSSQKDCVNHTVGYQKASGQWKISTPVLHSSYCLSPVSSGVVYTFKVRSGMSEFCGASHFWSDWSEQVQWIDAKGVNASAQPQWYWQVLGGVLGLIVLVGLSLLLYYIERVKVVFIPVVPDPSKSLQDLFKKYNGNVESWVYISRELKDAFEPDYTESPCVVCEPSPTIETNTEDEPKEQPAS